MKLLLLALGTIISISSVQANTLQCGASKDDTPTSGRMTPYFAVDFGGKTIKLGQQEFPSFEGCSFFCLGTRIYVYSQETLLGIIDENFEFHCPDKVLVHWIQPKPEDRYAANQEEVKYICSKVYYNPGY